MIAFEKITIIIRYLYVIFLLGTGIMTLVGWCKGIDMSARISNETSMFMKGIINAKYIVPFMGIFKVIAGLLLAYNPTSKVAILMCIPYVINILLYVIFISFKDYFLLGLVDTAVCFYLTYAYWDFYKHLLR